MTAPALRPSRHPAALSFGLLAFASLSSLPAATLYWSTEGAGASTAWQDGSVNWSGSEAPGATKVPWSNATRDTAAFRGAAVPTRVSVSDTVSAGALLFASGAHTLSGSPIVLGRASGSGSLTILTGAAGSGPVTIGNNLVVHDAGTIGATANYIIHHAGAGPLTLNGDLSVDYGDQPPAGNKAFHLQTGNANADIILNGNVSPGSAGPTASRFSLILGQGGSTRAGAESVNGTFHLNGTTSCGRTSVNGGTVLVANDHAFGSGSVALGNSGSRGDIRLLTAGPRTFANSFSVSGTSSSRIYIGASTAHESTFRGDMNLTGFGTVATGSALGSLGNPDPVVTTVAGAKVTFEGVLGTSVAIPRGLVKEGPGVVSLASPNGNTFHGLIAVNEGPLLLMNTGGSATGDASQLPPGAVSVLVAADARLGGTGIASRLVGAAAPSSVFAPGNMSKDGVSSVGTLNLLGGLVAKDGATFAFDIGGDTADQLNLGTAPLVLAGVVTVDFTAVGAVNTRTVYRLLTGSGDWSASSASFVFNAPAGYVLDPTHGEGKGYVFDPATRSLTVRFESLPEPSIYAARSASGVR